MSNFCNNCGAELFEGGTFCMKCGAPVNQAPMPQQAPPVQQTQQPPMPSNPVSQAPPQQPVSTGNMTKDFIEKRKRERGQY